jgi:sRNA-binding protein
LGVEKQIFQLISKEHLPYSKRVVQKVLSHHTRSREYLENTLRMNIRVSLQNTVSGDIQEKDKSYAKEKVSTISTKSL